MGFDLWPLALALNELPISAFKQYKYQICTHTNAEKIPGKTCITCSLSRFTNNNLDSEEVLVSITRVFPKKEAENGQTVTQMELVKAIFAHVSANREDFFMIKY
jgi:hypothetical protein